MQEIPNVVPLVADGRREILGSIAFDVVMFDVVIIVRIPRVTHQGLQNVRKCPIEPGPVLGQYAIVVNMIVHHQRKTSCAPECESHMSDAMEVREMVEEPDGAGEVDREVEQDMREKDDIGRVSYDARGNSGIWTHNVLVQERVNVLFIPGYEDGGLELSVIRVVERLETSKSCSVVLI